jgi:L,D-peptidoglycan transpeptidase YkuD (ErfK/YbiS/YcfS/YnhG family)
MTKRAVSIRLALPFGFALACQPGIPTPRAELDASQQLVVVFTSGWNSTTGTMTRFERATPTSTWSRLGNPIPLVVGRTGIAWGVGFDDVSTDGPHKHEGDGKAPAGIFPLDTAFGFAPADSMHSVQLPYVQLLPTTDCVDDTTSAHYNTVVDKAVVPRVDWNSAEHMRQVSQYEIGDRRVQRVPTDQRPRLLHLPSHLGWSGFTHSRMHRVRSGEAEGADAVARSP